MIKSLIKISLTSAIALCFSVGASAFDDDDEKKKDKMKAMGKDPMAIAEMQCENARKEEAAGEGDDEKTAEEKCAKAMEQAKKKLDKQAKKTQKDAAQKGKATKKKKDS